MEYLNELLTQLLQMQWTQRSASPPRTISVPPYKSNKRVSVPWPKAVWEQLIVPEEMAFEYTKLEHSADNKQFEAEGRILLRSLESLGKPKVSQKVDWRE
ncbi:unnamed protein product [Albugo candida]|uniref:Uncharacterized protein n=1 Tax=Albugo candida TaxID=65357 RepID=A0A024GB67_9STRA|nr:unnamed protein product [Albugo candida]|eukprot:CCI44003.1 unnamed protein product [Albugo candida]